MHGLMLSLHIDIHIRLISGIEQKAEEAYPILFEAVLRAKVAVQYAHFHTCWTQQSCSVITTVRS